MKIFIAFLILMTTGAAQQSEITKIRGLYDRAAAEEVAAEKLRELTKNSSHEDPLLYGYKGAAHMMMAKHVANPFKKLSHFNKGKDIFSEAIQAAPENVELRFLRFSVQAEAPGFLNYKQNLEEDKRILLSKTPTLKDAQLKRMILKYLLASKGLSSSEKEKLN